MADEEALKAAYSAKVVVLYTSYVSNQLFEVAWRKLETTLDGRRVAFTKIDGAAPEHKALRTKLWEISGKRDYPQVFVDGAYQGGMDDIQELIESGQFNDIFGKYVEQ
ncbi:hypothetical protein AB1Y20_012677 [Prymnesium parvum]|uniref:Glutaredoxin n=1 Tax=Prymnesium parvum TaxID=97485 RepID=A0AB34ILA8_PRYPA|mmetsp:Transcript_22876/g.34189  ORF Transcript_22876/g.34189 Transcript_22876/m.34189 type:complete len:108 (+) Transcript_22876:36-359(+)